MAPTGQGGEHPDGIGFIGGLAQDDPVQDYHGVGPDDDGLRVLVLGDVQALLPGEGFH